MESFRFSYDNRKGRKIIKLKNNIFLFKVLHAAHTVAERANSKHSRENLLLFKEAWLHQIDLLTDAVDDITTIDDFLAVSGWLFIFISSSQKLYKYRKFFFGF